MLRTFYPPMKSSGIRKHVCASRSLLPPHIPMLKHSLFLRLISKIFFYLKVAHQRIKYTGPDRKRRLKAIVPEVIRDRESLSVEPVSDAFYRTYDIANLLPDLAHVYINGPVSHDNIRSPHLVQDFLAGKDPPGSRGQQDEQFKFFPGQVDVVAPVGNRIFVFVDYQISGPENVCLRLGP